MHKPTISIEHLRNSGYHEWKLGHFQKRVENTIGIKYFIEIEIISIPHGLSSMTVYGVSMQTADDHGNVINVELVQWFNDDGRYSGCTLEDAEAYIERFWEFNGNHYYELK